MTWSSEPEHNSLLVFILVEKTLPLKRCNLELYSFMSYIYPMETVLFLNMCKYFSYKFCFSFEATLCPAADADDLLSVNSSAARLKL